MKPGNPLIVALDVARAEEARELVAALGDIPGMYKVGSQLFTAAGPAFVRELVERGSPVFLDLKYHDIPNTVAGAVRSAVDLGVTLLTVHASGGREMLAAAVAARAGSGTRILGITVLTSHTDATLAEAGMRDPVEPSVRRLARLARDAGADGVVASAHEIAAVRSECGADLLVVTPGIRPAGAALGDQARAATPAAARQAGADYLVVGRPITASADPAASARAILAELAAAEASDPARPIGVR